MKDIRKDLEEAKKIIDGELFDPLSPFSSHSAVYLFTNEKVNHKDYKKTLEKKERILTVIGSGDQILNSILLGSSDITGTDISNFTEYYFNLKKAAVKTLDYEDYLHFFNIKSKNGFSKNLYEKILPSLDEETAYFWSELFDSYKSSEIRRSNFFMPAKIKNYIRNNPYLSSNENYQTLKAKINEVEIKLIIENIFALIGTLKNGYDLINASNLMDYHYGSEYLFFLEQCYLKNDGIILGYSMARDITVDDIKKEYTNVRVNTEGYQIDKKHKLVLTRKK